MTADEGRRKSAGRFPLIASQFPRPFSRFLVRFGRPERSLLCPRRCPREVRANTGRHWLSAGDFLVDASNMERHTPLGLGRGAAHAVFYERFTAVLTFNCTPPPRHTTPHLHLPPPPPPPTFHHDLQRLLPSRGLTRLPRRHLQRVLRHDNGKNKKKKFGGFSRGNGFGGKKNGNGLGKKNGNGGGR